MASDVQKYGSKFIEKRDSCTSGFSITKGGPKKILLQGALVHGIGISSTSDRATSRYNKKREARKIQSQDSQNKLIISIIPGND